jgi:L-serine dehydratase
MTVSVFDLFKIGIGPSSSHTVGPMIAARHFASQPRRRPAGRQAATAHRAVRLAGATGRGHGTDSAVLLGLAGHEPDRIDPDQIAPALRHPQPPALALLGEHTVRFVEKEHLLLRRKSLPFHPNGLRFAALDAGPGTAGRRILLGGRRLCGR